MGKYRLYANLFLFVILFANIHEYYAAYNPPAVKVEPLYPTGLRMSIPDEHGITLVAFHVKFNEDFDGLEAGHIAKDILKVRDGRWTYEDRHTQLKRDDVIYYWVHVVYQGLGYNKIDQSERVTNFYNYDGTPYISDRVEEQSCTTKSATWIFKNGTRRSACPHQLLFEDNFDNIDSANWNLMQRFAGSPDYEFVVYMTNDVTDVSDGKLRIKPILLDTKFGKEFVSRGRLVLEGCTGEVGTSECQHQAAGAYILPPLISGRLNTKEKFEFLFGRIEIRAKLPHGDWVYPIITLESPENSWELGLHREIRVASAVGNEELKTPNNEDLSSHILLAGGLAASLSDNSLSINRWSLPKRSSSQSWTNDYHVFEIEWKSGLIVVKVDGVQYGEQPVDGSFGKRSYLTLGVAVGGIHEFADHTTSQGYVKPWRNVEARAMFNFHRAKDNWYPTWDTRTVLQVDYVKVWAL